MLHRDRQIRIQIHQFIDGGLFAVGLWLGWLIRHYWRGLPMAGLELVDPKDFRYYFWLFLVVIPVTPLILEWQGYYEQPIFAPRRLVFWQLGKACFIATVFVILIDFMLRLNGARGVYVLFGVCAFGLMVLKGELLRWAYQSKLGQAQFKQRVLLIGTAEDTRQLRGSIDTALEEVQILGELDLNKSSIEDLVSFLHEQSVNRVIINARNTLLGQVEAAIGACELEGIETLAAGRLFQNADFAHQPG